MQPAKPLNVNVPTRDHRQHKGDTGALLRMPGVAIPVPARERVWKYLTRGFEKVTVNKQIDSITLPKWAAVAILGAVLTFGIQSWTQRNADHDAMIRIETKLEAAEKASTIATANQASINSDMQSWRATMNGSVNELKGMIVQQQGDKKKRQ